MKIFHQSSRCLNSGSLSFPLFPKMFGRHTDLTQKSKISEKELPPKNINKKHIRNQSCFLAFILSEHGKHTRYHTEH